MKKFLLLTVLLCWSCVYTTNAEIIQRFDSKAIVDSDGSFRITERIVYDYENAERHGIYRDIPFIRDGKLFSENIILDDIYVVDEFGNAYSYTVSTEGAYKRIKIGDPDTFISGIHTYVISYSVKNAILFNDDNDELYWNVTGNNWQVEIASTSFSIELPQAISYSEYKSVCYFGRYGDTSQCKPTGVSPSPDTVTSTVSFPFSASILPGEGFTMAIGFPKGIVHEPTRSEKIMLFVQSNIFRLLSLLLPLIVLIICIYKWRKYGNDPESKTIIAQYDIPHNLIPLEVASIINQGITHRDITAEIISLAVRGYIIIEKHEEKKFLRRIADYKLIKVKEVTADMHKADKMLMEDIFDNHKERMISSLKYKFFKTYKDVSEVTHNILAGKGLYDENPEKVKAKYQFLLPVIFFVVILLYGYVTEDMIFIAAIILSAVIMFVFGYIMPRKTATGIEVYDHILGLKKYIEVAEKDRINFHNAPELSPKLFETLLPVAIVLGVEKAWAHQFKDMYTTQPDWYHGNFASFSSVNLNNDLSKGFAAATSTAFTAPKGSGGGGVGGGGFSGGGFGGGGGGSW